jgi:hypothetical protein
MAAMYAQQERLKPQPRPSDVDVQAWKNRHLISAKLTPETYPALMQFCKERDLSVNSALRLILTDYFHLSHE